MKLADAIDVADWLTSLLEIVSDHERRIAEAEAILGADSMDVYGDMPESDFHELARLAATYGLIVKRRKRAYRSKPGPVPLTEAELDQWAERYIRQSVTQEVFSDTNNLGMRHVRQICAHIRKKDIL